MKAVQQGYLEANDPMEALEEALEEWELEGYYIDDYEAEVMISN